MSVLRTPPDGLHDLATATRDPVLHSTFSIRVAETVKSAHAQGAASPARLGRGQFVRGLPCDPATVDVTRVVWNGKLEIVLDSGKPLRVCTMAQLNTGWGPGKVVYPRRVGESPLLPRNCERR